MSDSGWVPEVGDHVVFPTGRGVVRLQPDVNNVVIVEDYNDGYKRVAASACEPIPTEEDRAVEEMRNVMAKHAEVTCRQAETLAVWLYAAGYRKPTEDLADPANWQTGDVVVAIHSGLDITKGHFYSLFMDQYNELIFLDDVDDERAAKHHAHLVTFHSRP